MSITLKIGMHENPSLMVPLIQIRLFNFIFYPLIVKPFPLRTMDLWDKVLLTLPLSNIYPLLNFQKTKNT